MFTFLRILRGIFGLSFGSQVVKLLLSIAHLMHGANSFHGGNIGGNCSAGISYRHICRTFRFYALGDKPNAYLALWETASRFAHHLEAMKSEPPPPIPNGDPLPQRHPQQPGVLSFARVREPKNQVVINQKTCIVDGI